MHMDKIQAMQRDLQASTLDGWLFYDYQRSNPLALDILGFDKNIHLSRRLFYWIPSIGSPIKIVSATDSSCMQHLPGETLSYISRLDLENHIKCVLRPGMQVAMEYSPFSELPQISMIEAGIFEWLTSLGICIKTSSDLLQNYTCLLSDSQIASHQRASHILQEIAKKTWEYIATTYTTQKGVTEYLVVQFIQEEFQKNGVVTEGSPICAVGANGANPHYQPTEEKSQRLLPGEVVYIDLWCKERESNSIFADYTQTGFLGRMPSIEQRHIFTTVRDAQQIAINFIEMRLSQGKEILGYEVDKVVREFIAKQGFESYFIHRTGHNIYTTVHGPGVNLDDLENKDRRALKKRVCFSIEPGIYIPGKIGVRLECNGLILPNGKALFTGLLQKDFIYI